MDEASTRLDRNMVLFRHGFEILVVVAGIKLSISYLHYRSQDRCSISSGAFAASHFLQLGPPDPSCPPLGLSVWNLSRLSSGCPEPGSTMLARRSSPNFVGLLFRCRLHHLLPVSSFLLASSSSSLFVSSSSCVSLFVPLPSVARLGDAGSV